MGGKKTRTGIRTLARSRTRDPTDLWSMAEEEFCEGRLITQGGYGESTQRNCSGRSDGGVISDQVIVVPGVVDVLYPFSLGPAKSVQDVSAPCQLILGLSRSLSVPILMYLIIDGVSVRVVGNGIL